MILEAGEQKKDGGSKSKNRRRSRKKKSTESNNKNGSEEKLTGISSGSSSKIDHLHGKASSRASSAHPVPDETASMDVHSLIEHTRRFLNGLLAYFPDDLAFPAPTESKNKHLAMKTMEGAVGFTSPSNNSSNTVLEDEPNSLLNTSFTVVNKEKSAAHHHPGNIYYYYSNWINGY